MTYQFSRSSEHFERSKRHLARGVATAFRANQRPVPICFARGEGARLWDIDDNEYVDYVLGFGPLVLGHSPKGVVSAVSQQVHEALGFGASHVLEAELAEAVCRNIPSAELCIFSNTGSEAVHAAVRVARAVTGRSRVVKFLGHYHGWLDGVHSGTAPQSQAGPGTAGQDPRALDNLTVATWNDLDILESVLDEDVAAVIMEPVNVNGGTILPTDGYLAGAIEAAHRYGSLVIFDEVITGFRLALGGAQERYRVTPDLTVLGKALGAGFPISAVCGKEDVLSVVAEGRVAHVGTFNANPVCSAAALAAITELEQGGDELYGLIERSTDEVAHMLSRAAESHGIPLFVNQVCGVVTAFISGVAPVSYEDGLRGDRQAIGALVAALLGNGVHAISDGRLYLSSAHGGDDLAWTAEAVERAFASVAQVNATLASGAP